jgi:hypothetical protein
MSTDLYKVSIFEFSNGEKEDVFSEIIEIANMSSVEFSLQMLTNGTDLSWEISLVEATATLESITSRIQSLLE